MELEIGGTYEIVTDVGQKYVVRIKNETPIRYDVTVLESNDDIHSGYSGHILKGGSLLTKSTITRLDMPLPELVKLQEAYGDDKPKRRRTPVEIEIDNLIEHVQRNIKIQELEELIDMALATKNESMFIELSKEYAKLKKKVTA